MQSNWRPDLILPWRELLTCRWLPCPRKLGSEGLVTKFAEVELAAGEIGAVELDKAAGAYWRPPRFVRWADRAGQRRAPIRRRALKKPL